jgi:hypothetical protein
LSWNRLSRHWWLWVGLVAAVLWWFAGRDTRTPLPGSASPAASSTAYQPRWRERRGTEPVAQGSTAAVAGDPQDDDDELTPELRLRLEAASNIVTVPAPGYVPPPTAELTPAISADLQRGLPAWTTLAQQSLDRCVGRPEAVRREVHLSVMFTPSVTAPPSPGAAPPIPSSLSPAYVAVHPDDLRRLWKDTDPDALQSCIDQLRVQALPVASSHIAAGLAPPSLHENVTVKL